MDKTDKKPKKGIMAILGMPSDAPDDDSSDEDMDSSSMALKAVWRAIKDDDQEGFSEAMTEWYSSCGGHEK